MSAPIDMKVNLNPLKSIINDLDRNQKKYYNILAKMIQKAFLKETKKRAPKDTGAYARSWREGKITISDTKIKITIETPQGELYIILEEEGSEPHTIDSPVLINNVGWRYIKEHPGFPPIPHVKPAIRHVMDVQFQKINDAALRQAFPNVFR